MKRRLWYWITDALGALFLLGTTIFVLVRWQSIPAQVPSHFGVDGQITSYSDKSSLLFLVVVFWILFVAMEVLSFFPQSWNIPRRTPRAYQAAADAMSVLRLFLSALLGYLVLCTALCRATDAWVFPVIFAGILGSTAYMLIGSFRG